MVACQRAYKWGLKHGYIDKSPLEHLEKPSATRRDNCPRLIDFKAMLEHTNDCYADVLEYSWETGSRPQEIFLLKVKHVKKDRIELSIEESKGKKQKRVIFLTQKAAIITRKLTNGREQEEFVFLNTKGRPWNAHSVGCRMGKLKKKTGKRFGLYDIRHAFATRMLESGLDHFTVAKLLGHKDASMLAKTYSHIGEKNNYLLQQLRKVS